MSRLNVYLDINECHVNDLAQEHLVEYSHNCHADSNCTNTKGSFYCTCLNGYSGDGVTCLGKKFVVNLPRGRTWAFNFIKTPDPFRSVI